MKWGVDEMRGGEDMTWEWKGASFVASVRSRPRNILNFEFFRFSSIRRQIRSTFSISRETVMQQLQYKVRKSANITSIKGASVNISINRYPKSHIYTMPKILAVATLPVTSVLVSQAASWWVADRYASNHKYRLVCIWWFKMLSDVHS